MRSIFAAAAVLLSLSAVPAFAGDLTGTMWNTDGGRAKVAFQPCKSGVCGSIVALAEPNDENGKPLIDHRNPDPAMQKRPVMGIITLYNIAPAGGSVWNAVSYDPRNGQVHEVTLTLDGDTLVLKGCGLGGLICKTFNWTSAGMVQ
jgi:uncharacterized protein (DUF2147 family)